MKILCCTKFTEGELPNSLKANMGPKKSCQNLFKFVEMNFRFTIGKQTKSNPEIFCKGLLAKGESRPPKPIYQGDELHSWGSSELFDGGEAKSTLGDQLPML